VKFAVAFAEIVNCVPFTIDVITVFAGIPGPLTAIPTVNPVVLATVTVALFCVVFIPATVAV
jgi:hypothetical protein